jgi:hypothetical protein
VELGGPGSCESYRLIDVLIRLSISLTGSALQIYTLLALPCSIKTSIDWDNLVQVGSIFKDTLPKLLYQKNRQMTILPGRVIDLIVLIGVFAKYAAGQGVTLPPSIL